VVLSKEEGQQEKEKVGSFAILLTMTHEVETKVLDINTDEIIQKLLSLGAEKILETRLSVDWFRQKGIAEGKDSWFLRIRSDSAGKHEVTWKAVAEVLGVARKHKEINFNIDDPMKMADLFEELGLEKYAHQEKDRKSFLLKDWRFDIDQYPEMPAYLEIEGKDESHIKEVLKLLDLEKNRTWAKGERTLIQEIYKLDWYSMNF
jgi:adenylate cyclase class 2